MVARNMLAVMDFNENVNRPQAVTQAGNVFRVVTTSHILSNSIASLFLSTDVNSFSR